MNIVYIGIEVAIQRELLPIKQPIFRLKSQQIKLFCEFHSTMFSVSMLL